MGRHGVGRLGAAAAAVAVAAFAAPPAGAARTTVFASRLWKIDAIAMDGANVAMAREANLEVSSASSRQPTFADCHEVDVAGVASRRLVRLSLRSRGFYCSGGFGGSEGSTYLALAGRRAFWVYAGIGNDLTQSLLTGAPGSAQRVLAGPFVGPHRDTGPFVGPLAAGGTTFAYSRYARPWLPIGCDPGSGRCTLGSPRDFSLTLGGRRVAMPAPGGVVASADAGRAAVLLTDGRVAIVARRASAVVTTAAASMTRRADDAALAGRWLVVLAAGRIRAFDAATGRLHASWPARGATHVDVWNGIAVLTTARQVVALRVSNGHRRLVQQVGRGRSLVAGAQIAAGGIVWATRPARDDAYHRGLDAIFRVPVPQLR